MHVVWHLLGCHAVFLSPSLAASSAAQCDRAGTFSDGECPGNSGRALIQQSSKTQSSKGHKGNGGKKKHILHPSQMALQIDGSFGELRLQSDDGDSETMDSSDQVARAMAEAAREDKPKAASTIAEMGKIIRPNHGKEADIVQIGILVKKFLGVKFGENSFEADVLVISTWVDKRAASLLKKGSKTLSLSGPEAGKILWVPDIVITNRMFDALDLLSSVVQVHGNGTVMKVDRCHATMISLFVANAFPFDSQILPIKVASSSLMVDQLILRIDPALTGVEDYAFEDDTFKFLSSSTQTYEEFDGPLQKSRAKLDMLVKRKPASFISTVLLPCLFITTTAWSGFFLPCNLPAFMMPRVATSFLSFLMQVTLDAKIDDIQPERSTDSWLDNLHTSLEATVYFAVVANIIVQYAAYYENEKELGKTFDQELQIFLPVLTALLFAVCLSFAGVNEQVYELKIFTFLMLAFSIIPYLITMIWRIRSHKRISEQMAAPHKMVGSELPPFQPAPMPVQAVPARYASTAPAHY
mmetsp:Transcript_60406/g.107631  ORF Transcript_60406/g.107631 Transcript_60406/m.107631 type:complete len:525 (-) Transcript_60406:40-1614(-)